MIKVIESSSSSTFETICNEWIALGYKVISCYCGWSESFECWCYSAVLEKPRDRLLSSDINLQ